MIRTKPPRTFFQGREFTRLGMMVFMLIMLFMMISRTRDPRSWEWLARDNPGGAEGNGAAASPSPTAAPAAKPSEKAPIAAAAPLMSEDPEETDALTEELQTVTDKTLEFSKVEMPAYWRLMTWAQSASPTALAKQANGKVVFNDFIKNSAQLRGKLIRLDLNVRRILSYDAQPDNPAGVKKVYEIWGFTEQSQAWLYVAVTGELPEGMPQGASIDERVSFYGYFFKLQGYHEAGARPNSRPLFAPLLVGRVVWRSAPPAAAPLADNFPWWMWVLFAGVLMIAVYFLSTALRGRKRMVLVGPVERPEQLDQWFSEPSDEPAASGEQAAEEKALDAQPVELDLPGLENPRISPPEAGDRHGSPPTQ